MRSMVGRGLLTVLRSRAAADPVEPVAARPTQRLQSLDVFRGLTIAAMLLVNNPGTWSHVYPPLEHAEWNGWTPTDLVFPFFLFIVGIATALSLGGLREAGTGRAQVFRKALVRAAIIFGLGLLLQGFPHYDLPHLRIPGVLQRIAIAYLLTAIVVLLTGMRGQVLTLLGLLLGYWTLMTLVPVPGVGREGLGAVLRGQHDPAARVGLEPHLPDQQEPVDQLLRAPLGGAGLPGALRDLLAGRHRGLPRLDRAVPGLRDH